MEVLIDVAANNQVMVTKALCQNLKADVSVYSAFEAAARRKSAGMVEYLFENQINESMSLLKQVVAKSSSAVVTQLLVAVPTIPRDVLRNAMAFASELNELHIVDILSDHIKASET